MRVSDPRLREALLWDGGCAFCRRSVALFERLARRRVRTLPAEEAAGALPAEAAAASREQVLWVDTEGAIHGGALAAALALRAAGRPFLGWMIGNAAVLPLSRAVYRWIARRRSRLGCGRG
jgi:predicted DCC family thiol-disulfide oxidoreductase YuxK